MNPFTFICGKMFIVLMAWFILAPQMNGEDNTSKRELKLNRSVLFKKISDNTTLYQENSTDSVIPASVTKLMTSATLLYKLSPAHQFKTEIYYTGKRENSTINGDLLLKGGGDPFLTSEKLWEFSADLYNLGIRKIKGGIVIDNSLFNDKIHDPSRITSLKSSNHAYDAPISALGTNFNTFVISIAPGQSIGSAALVNFDPYSIPGIKVINRATTVQNQQNQSPRVSRMSSKNGESTIIIDGTIAINSPIRKIYRSTSDPLTTSGEQIKSFLQARGIFIEGKIKEQNNTEILKKHIYTINGFDLAYITKGLNQFSNNYIADVLVKDLGAFCGKEGSMKEGVNVILDFLKNDVGLKTIPILLNGSGLDHNNQISAEQLVELLIFMSKRIDIFPEFLASIPVASRDGTMKKRFHQKNIREFSGLVRAKTGTLSYPVTVSSIAGYIQNKKHGLIAFAILDNGTQGAQQPSHDRLRKEQDILISKVLGDDSLAE